MESSGKKIWNFIKRKAGWVKSLSATTINNNGIIQTSPVAIVNTLNDLFIGKVEKINSDLSNRVGNPVEVWEKFWDK